MISFNYEFEYLNINEEAFRTILLSKINQLARSAAVAFLRAAAVRVPVRTGFAHGAFGNLANVLNVELPPGALGTKPRTKEYYYGRKAGRLLKTPSTGATRGTPQNAIFILNPDGTVQFTFDINITYFTINDLTVNPRNRNTPWNAYREGVNAFNAFIERNIEDIVPNIDDWITKQAFFTTSKTRT